MLKNSKLISETEENYHIQLPSGHKMSLNKKGLHKSAHEVIKSMKVQKFSDGGSALASENIDPNGIDNNFGAGQAQVMGGELQNAQQAPIPVTPINKISSQNKAFEAEKEASQGAADVIAQQGAKELQDIQGTQSAINQIPKQSDVFKKYQEADLAAQDAYKNKQIDPDHYWKDKSTGSKISAGIGMLLSGFGSLAGQGNVAANMIQDAIKTDIDAQKEDQSKSLNLWKMNKEKMGSEMAANLATENQLYNGLKHKLEAAASQFKGPMAQQQAKAGIALIQQKQDDNNFKLSLMNSGDGDPAMKVQYLVPPEKQKEVFEEIKNAQNVKRGSIEGLDAFDKANEEQNLLSKNSIPYINSPYIGAIKASVLPQFQNIDGTVRQAAMDAFLPTVTPEVGDSEHKIEVKRRTLENWYKAHSSAPVAKGFGIDLEKYQSTNSNTPGAEVARKLPDGKVGIFDSETKKFIRYQ